MRFSRSFVCVVISIDKLYRSFGGTFCFTEIFCICNWLLFAGYPFRGLLNPFWNFKCGGGGCLTHIFVSGVDGGFLFFDILKELSVSFILVIFYGVF